MAEENDDLEVEAEADAEAEAEADAEAEAEADAEAEAEEPFGDGRDGGSWLFYARWWAIGCAIILLLPRQWYAAGLAAILAALLALAWYLKEGRYEKGRGEAPHS